ncbi:MAG: STAS domain-containing protein [Planctomycetaceae bacterium]|nr:STAS domain-containing protein [Planctomycetaceae bacterium]
MKVEIQELGEVTVVSPHGRLDALTSPELSETLAPLLDEPTPVVILDMTHVPFVSSAGLRVVIETAKQMMGRGRLGVCGLTRQVHEIFQLAGFDRILTICDDVASTQQTLNEPDPTG